MKLSTRLTLAMVGLVLFTAIAVGLLTYRNLEADILPRALERVEIRARLLADNLQTYVRGARADISGFRSAVELDGIVRARLAGGVDPLDGTMEAIWRQRMASQFAVELAAKPEYFRFRIIGIEGNGREIVRVDRSGADGAIRIVPDDELQQQGDQDYFKATIGLAADEIYVSPAGLSKDNGIVLMPPIPVVRVAAPIRTADLKPFGIVIITVDMRPIFSQIRSTVRAGSKVYVVNNRGDYLVHPTRNREFGFELGTTGRWQDEFPKLVTTFGTADSAARLVTDPPSDGDIAGMARVQVAGTLRFSVMEIVPNAVIMASAATVHRSSLLAGLASVLCAAFIAAILARSLAKSLVQMTGAAEGVARGRSLTIPTEAGGEIGVLARAFARMISEMQEKAAALEREIELHRDTEADLERHAGRERIFIAAVESSEDAIVTKTLDGIITGWNPAAERLFGFAAQEAIGRSIDIIVPDDRQTEARDILQKIRQGELVNHFETVRVSKDRKRIDVSLSVSPVKSPSGAIIGACKIARDVTDQKLAEQKFQLAVEASPSGMVMIDHQGQIILVNAEMERLFGYRRDEMIGHPIEILVPPSLRPQHSQHRQEFAVRPEARRMGVGRDLYGQRKDGTGFPVEIGLNPINTSSGMLVLGVIVDITESKKSEEALRSEVEERSRIVEVLNNTITSMVDAVLVADERGNILLSNPAAARLMGVAPGISPSGLSQDYDIFTPDGVTPVPIDQQPIMSALRGEAIDNREFIIRLRSDGKSINLVANGGPIFDSSKLVKGAVVVYRDVTETQETERQLRQAQKMDAIGQLTGGIAHDFNNILTVITGTIEILADAVADRPQLAAITKMIDEAAGRGAELTQRLLAFARRQPLQPRETDINALIVEGAKLLRATLGEQIEIESMLKDDAWRALVDPSQLTTALLNLALNARDAMAGGGKLTLETANVYLDESYASTHSDVRVGPYVLIAVSDTGSGIPAAIMDKVFEPFFTTKGVGKGTGLGLSMVYGFVKQSGGHIKVYSEEGHGTTIKVYLPRASEDPSYPAAMPPSAPIEGGLETILIVEDDDLVRTYVVIQVQSLGYTTLAANNAAEALAVLDGGAQIDLLFTDVIMPGAMNGRHLADEAVKRRPLLKVLFTSGYTENAIVHHGRLDPGVLLLEKPYRKSDLANMIRLALAAT